MTVCERCADLEAELSDLRKELVYEIDQALWLKVQRQFGLTSHQGIILAALCQAKGRVVSKAALSVLNPPVRGRDRESDQVVDVHVGRIRKKLSFDCIENVWGRGYRALPALLDACSTIKSEFSA